MLKYPKDKNTNEPDYSRPPTLKVKIPYWEGEFKNIELYNDKKELVFPNDDDIQINEFLVKGSNIATIIQCGGIWVANGKFGVTWKLFQAVVKPKTTLSGKCHISLSDKDKELMNSAKEYNEDDDDDEELFDAKKENKTIVEDSDEEINVSQEVKEEITKKVEVEDQPKKKVVRKKKASVEE